MTTNVAQGFLIFSDAQAKLTLGRMRTKIRQAIEDHDFVWWCRGEISRLSPDAIQLRDWTRVARTVREYVEAHIRYTPDPVGVENITDPIEHMRLLQANPHAILLGDCDDAATLGASMGEALGIPATLTIMAFWAPNSPYQHVVAYLHPKGGGVIDIDTTREEQKLPPVATRKFTVRV